MKRASIHYRIELIQYLQCQTAQIWVAEHIDKVAGVPLQHSRVKFVEYLQCRTANQVIFIPEIFEIKRDLVGVLFQLTRFELAQCVHCSRTCLVVPTIGHVSAYGLWLVSRYQAVAMNAMT